MSDNHILLHIMSFKLFLLHYFNFIHPSNVGSHAHWQLWSYIYHGINVAKSLPVLRSQLLLGLYSHTIQLYHKHEHIHTYNKPLRAAIETKGQRKEAESEWESEWVSEGIRALVIYSEEELRWKYGAGGRSEDLKGKRDVWPLSRVRYKHRDPTARTGLQYIK